MGVRTLVGRVALAGFASAIFASTMHAAQYVVAPSGNDLAAGSAAAPWKTLQHAAEEVGPGDFVTVKPGNYAGFHLETSGTAAAPITFFAEPGVLVNQPNPIRTNHGINLENASYVTVDGFAVTGMPQAGIRSVGFDGDEFASHVTIRNVARLQQRQVGHTHRLRERPVDREERNVRLRDRTRHLRFQ